TLNIKIIGLAPFARIIQDGTPAFQLHISLALPEEHLGADTTTLEPKSEEQILHEVVPPEYHEFAAVFSEGRTKELLPHWSYKIYLKDGTALPFSKIYNMSEVELCTLKDYLDNMLAPKSTSKLTSTPATTTSA
ncbi:hypothetical protein C0993_012502, partial [Termitomyces sp. T159_Od127]